MTRVITQFFVFTCLLSLFAAMMPWTDEGRWITVSVVSFSIIVLLASII